MGKNALIMPGSRVRVPPFPPVNQLVISSFDLGVCQWPSSKSTASPSGSETAYVRCLLPPSIEHSAAPCAGCPRLTRCRTEHLACSAAQAFMLGSKNYRVSETPESSPNSPVPPGSERAPHRVTEPAQWDW